MRISFKSLAIALFGLTALFTSCEDSNGVVDLDSIVINVENLPYLGEKYAYEVWATMKDGKEISLRQFSVYPDGSISKSAVYIDERERPNIVSLRVTIEERSVFDNIRSDQCILAGDVKGSIANLSMSDPRALGSDFSTGKGNFILATPTNGSNTNETSGIWYSSPNGSSAALTLPKLPKGWQYEGWVVVNGVTLSTGTFTDPSKADDILKYGGDQEGYKFPGEDFLKNSPNKNIPFPTDLKGQKTFITVEPILEKDHQTPFSLRVLEDSIDPDASNNKSYLLTNVSSTHQITGEFKFN